MFSKTSSIWPLEADFEQQCGHWLQVEQKTSDLHRNNFHIFYCLYNGSYVFLLWLPGDKRYMTYSNTIYI